MGDTPKISPPARPGAELLLLLRIRISAGRASFAFPPPTLLLIPPKPAQLGEERTNDLQFLCKGRKEVGREGDVGMEEEEDFLTWSPQYWCRTLIVQCDTWAVPHKT